jgi:hypothetical protein
MDIKHMHVHTHEVTDQQPNFGMYFGYTTQQMSSVKGWYEKSMRVGWHVLIMMTSVVGYLS